MQVASGDGPSSEKRISVSNVNSSNDTLNFASAHNFITGETVRIYSDNGYTPDGIDNESVIYFAINSTSTSIKLAKTRNAAEACLLYTSPSPRD